MTNLVDRDWQVSCLHLDPSLSRQTPRTLVAVILFFVVRAPRSTLATIAPRQVSLFVYQHVKQPAGDEQGIWKLVPECLHTADPGTNSLSLEAALIRNSLNGAILAL